MEYIDRLHYEDLSGLDPVDVCRRCPCTYDADKKTYTLTVWGETYCITPGEYRMHQVGPTAERGFGYLGLFVIHYLLENQSITPEEIWISEKEIPGGATFFRGPHALPTELIANRFGNDLAAFKTRCETLHGSRLEMGDAAYRFDIVPQVPVAVLYWCGDEEFPAEAKLLFDRSIGRTLAADVVYALAVGVCERLGEVPNGQA
ncbi:MAG: DUF3786 domain-containing protein [Desulfosarcinaceae bacterium]|jgi:hypothetical protein